MNILVVGSIALDTVETPFGSVDNSPGGSALYFSHAASFFAPVNVVGVVGTDFDPGLLTSGENKHIDFEGVYTENGKTFRWGGHYHKDPNKRDTLFTDLNVFEHFKPQIPPKFRKSEIVFLANIDPNLQLQVLEQIEKPKLVVLDTMNFWISGQRPALVEVIAKTDVIILNDEETKQLTGETNLIRGGQKVLDMGPDTVIIKKGEHGAVMIKNDVYFVAPAYPVKEVIDPTGAGDSFAGGFVGYLADRADFSDSEQRKAVINGTVIASFCVQDFSFKKLLSLTDEQINERIDEIRKFTQY